MKRKYLFLVLAAFMSILLVLIMLSHTESLNSPILALNDLVPIEVDNVSQIQKLASLKEPGGLDALAFDPLDKRLASGNTDGEIHLIDTTTGSRIFTLDGNYPIKTIAFSPDGTLMAAGTQIGMSQGGLILWNLTDHSQNTMLNGSFDWVINLVFSPDGDTIVSGGNDGTVRLWDVSTQHEIVVLRGHTDWVFSVAFSPDGNMIASGSNDGTVRLWDVSTQREIAVLRGHTDGVSDLAYSPDGTYLASGSSDNTILIWTVSDGRAVRILQGHTGGVISLSYNADGTILASVARDGTLRIWNAATGDPLMTIPFYNTLGLQGVQFSHDGRLLALSMSGELQVWGVVKATTLP